MGQYAQEIMKKKRAMTNRMLSGPVVGRPLQKKLELDISEGTVYGARYYTVSPQFPAHAPTWFKPEWDAMIAWTVATFGPTPKDGVWTPNAKWYVNNAKFWFKERKDLEWFLLKWQ